MDRGEAHQPLFQSHAGQHRRRDQHRLSRRPGPRSWVERSYHKLICFNEVDKGGHFAAWDELELFSTEVRAAFTSDLCAEGSSL